MTDDDDWGSPAPAPRRKYAKACACRIDWNADRTAGLVHELCARHEATYLAPFEVRLDMLSGMDDEIHEVVMRGDVKHDTRRRVSAPVANFAVARKRS